MAEGKGLWEKDKGDDNDSAERIRNQGADKGKG